MPVADVGVTVVASGERTDQKIVIEFTMQALAGRSPHKKRLVPVPVWTGAIHAYKYGVSITEPACPPTAFEYIEIRKNSDAVCELQLYVGVVPQEVPNKPVF